MQKWKILVIEDDKDLVRKIVKFLKRENFTTIEALDGRTGIYLARERQPDLVISDIQMPPGIDGFEVLTELQKDPRTKDIPLIFLTVRDKTDDILKGFKLGARDYVAKPFEMKILMQRLSLHLQLKEREKKLTEALAEKSEAYQKLKAGLEQKRKFLYRIEHNLRTQLTTIRGHAEILKKEITEQCLAPIVNEVMDASGIMADMIGDNFTKVFLTNGVLKFEKKVVNFAKVLASVVKVNQVHAARKNQEILLQIQEPGFVEGGEMALWEAVENLINNAIKFSPPAKTINVTLKNENDSAILSIQDQGPGFTDDDKKNLFTKYQPLSAKPTANEPSSGIGLFITREIILQHNGIIQLESKEGKGATFIVTIPAVSHK